MELGGVVLAEWLAGALAVALVEEITKLVGHGELGLRGGLTIHVGLGRKGVLRWAIFVMSYFEILAQR